MQKLNRSLDQAYLANSYADKIIKWFETNPHVWFRNAEAPIDWLNSNDVVFAEAFCLNRLIQDQVTALPEKDIIGIPFSTFNVNKIDKNRELWLVFWPSSCLSGFFTDEFYLSPVVSYPWCKRQPRTNEYFLFHDKSFTDDCIPIDVIGIRFPYCLVDYLGNPKMNVESWPDRFIDDLKNWKWLLVHEIVHYLDCKEKRIPEKKQNKFYSLPYYLLPWEWNANFVSGIACMLDQLKSNWTMVSLMDRQEFIEFAFRTFRKEFVVALSKIDKEKKRFVKQICRLYDQMASNEESSRLLDYFAEV